MFTEVIQPRFSETDALGHINNTVVPNWFEKAREPLFRMFTPDLDPKKWQLIIARIEVDFKAEIFFPADVTIKTWLERIGQSSMSIVQQVWQENKLCAEGRSAMIHFDWQEKKARPIPEVIRQQLVEHLIPASPDS
jgi:acyl-CoA thioester hydrolase